MAMKHNQKRILVGCGSAVSTSTVVAYVIEQQMTARGIVVETTCCKSAEVQDLAAGHDLVATTTYVAGTVSIPIVRVVSLLTGEGESETIDEILSYFGGK